MPYKHRPMSEILAPQTPEPQEGQTATPAPAPEASEVPEKYRGKSVEEVIEMHRNSESRLGQLQNEVGSLRGLVTDLSQVQRPTVTEQVEEVESVTVSGEEILSNPTEAVERIVQPHLDNLEKKKELDAAEAQLLAENAALVSQFDIDAIVATPEFQQFASRTPSRQADFNTAATGEGLDQVRAARRLLEDFEDFQKQTAQPQTPTPTPVEQARNVSTESGSVAAPISSKPMIYEADVIKLINTDQAKYRSPSFQAELLEAIREGRYVKS